MLQTLESRFNTLASPPTRLELVDRVLDVRLVVLVISAVLAEQHLVSRVVAVPEAHVPIRLLPQRQSRGRRSPPLSRRLRSRDPPGCRGLGSSRRRACSQARRPQTR